MTQSKLLEATFARIKEYINQIDSTDVVDYQDPEQLSEKIDLSVDDHPVTEQEFIKLIDDYLHYSVKTGNKQFLNQLYGGFNLPSFIGDVLTSLTNTSMYTYEVAPVASLVEKEMIKLMNSYIGYHQGDGIFLSGGSNANLVAMFSARNKVSPHSRFEGYDKNEKLVAFVNEHSHYSFDTAANLLGIGSNNLIKVKTDVAGSIIPAELERSILATIEEGKKPFFIGATCSTTMQGAYDPLNAIADIANKYGVWFHADGAFGGSIILSDEHNHMMNGIHRTDSFAWDPHKLMNIPLICSVILTREKGVLENNLTDINTDYIYHNNEEMTDLGEKSIQCGRHVDAVKLWFAWKYYGKDGYDKRISNMINIARYAEEIVKNHPDLEMVSPRQSFSVCFRYRPPFETNPDEFNFMVREKMRRDGKSMVNYGYVNDQMTIRFVASNGDLEKKDIDQFFNHYLHSAKICIDECMEKDEA